MHVGIFGTGLTDSSEKFLKKILDENHISSSKIGTKSKNKKSDCVFVLGGDKGVRNYFHRTFDSSIPVLGINESESDGFLSQLDLKQLPSLISRIKKMDFQTEQVTRLGVKIDGKNVYPVLNDVAVFSSRSAMLMEHTLRVNGDEVWHDSSDGVIISTPIGSSAYSMSAGGPVIFQAANVFGIISVNSLDITRRPIIVSDNSIIEIDEISSRLHCDVVLDGIDRLKINSKLEATRFTPPARIIRMKSDSTAISALANKVKLAEELLAMPPSSKLLLKILEYEGSMTQKELASKTLLPDRTVRLAMKHLMEKGYVKRKVSMQDARQKIYEITKLD